MGLRLRSFVYPRNTIGHLDTLAGHGFEAYRGLRPPIFPDLGRMRTLTRDEIEARYHEFRRIAFFPDRPDVLSTYKVRMEGPKDLFPVLLSNGNRTACGEADDGTHWAEWHDPWPKPSYLFALVAGDLVANRDAFIGWVLSFGASAEVLAPAELRAEILNRVNSALENSG